MSTKGVIGFRGYKPSGNELTQPPGSLVEAINCVIPSKDELMPRRGQKLQVDASGNPVYFDDDSGDSEGYRARELRQWLTHLVISSFHTNSGGYKLLSRENFLTAGEVGHNYGNFAPPEPLVLRMKFAELAQSLYLTTSAGVATIDAIANSPRAAGVTPPRGAVSGPEDTGPGMLANGGCKLLGNPSAVGSWLPADSQVAARAVIGIKDANDIPHLSAPCGRVVVKNPAALTMAIGGVVRAGNIVTATMAAGQQHSYRWGDIINLTLSGADIGNFNTSNNVITGVTATTISWAQVAAGYTNVAAVVISSGIKAVQWVFAIPSGLTADVHFVQVYRTDETALASIDPGDECFQVYERYLSSTDISNGYVTITDDTPSSLALGPPLSTNENTGDGIDAGANDRPPLMRDLCEWDSTLWGAQCVDRHKMTLRVLGVGSPAGMQSGDFVAIGDMVYIGGTHQSVSTAGLPTENMARCASSLVSYSHIFRTPTGQTLHLVANTTLGLPQILIDSDLLTGSKFYAGCSRTTAFQEPLPVVTAVTEASSTRTSNVVTITTTTPHGLTNGSSAMLARSGAVDANFPTGLKGPITVTGASTFTYAETGANATMTNTFYVYAASFGSTQDKKPLRFTRKGLPEAWPAAFFTGGLPDGAEVLRVTPLSSGAGLLVALKAGGFYTITGAYPYIVRPMPGTKGVALVAADSLLEHNGALHCLTTQGICTLRDAGIGILSGDVDELVRLMIARTLDASIDASVPFAVGYESDHQYHLYLPTQDPDSEELSPGVGQDLVLRSLTGEFCGRWLGERTCGLVWRGGDVLVLGDSNTNRLRVERKTLSAIGGDFADEQIDIAGTFTQLNATTCRYTVTGGTDLSAVGIGDALELPRATGTMYRVVGSDATHVDFTAVLTPASTNARVIVGYPVTATWVGDSRGTPGVESRWRQLQLHFQQRLFDKILVRYQGEKSDTTEPVTVRGRMSGSFAFFTAVSRLSTLRAKVPDNFERVAIQTISLELEEAFSYFKLLGYSGSGAQVTDRTGQ